MWTKKLFFNYLLKINNLLKTLEGYEILIEKFIFTEKILITWIYIDPNQDNLIELETCIVIINLVLKFYKNNIF